jgi:uncharacterized protein YraI
MSRTLVKSICAVLLVASCSATGDGRVVVKGTGPDDLLKLRYGPGLGYKVLLGLPDGTELRRHSCTTEMGQLWCRVSLARAPGVTGFVSADYLSAP